MLRKTAQGNTVLIETVTDQEEEEESVDQSRTAAVPARKNNIGNDSRDHLNWNAKEIMSSGQGRDAAGLSWKQAAIVAVVSFLFAVLVLPLQNKILAVVFPGSNSIPPSSASTCQDAHGDLLTGYKILHHTLVLESQLKYLKVLRIATLRGPTGELERLLTQIYKTSSDRSDELKDLWQLEPMILLSEAPVSEIGDDIQSLAEGKGTMEMVGARNSTWAVRFYMLQTQATRMVAALAIATSRKETNVKRRRWLKQLAAEYESLRDDLVEAVAISGCNL